MSFLKKISARFFIALTLVGAAELCLADATDEATPTTVIGVRNTALADGATALQNRDAKRGVKLTLQGLAVAQGSRERVAALANLCAGYVMLEQLDTALDYCNQAIAINDRSWRAYSNRALVYLRLARYEEAAADVERGQELSPDARILKVVKGLLLDETQPVSPTIVIDDRRVPKDDES